MAPEYPGAHDWDLPYGEEPQDEGQTIEEVKSNHADYDWRKEVY